MQVLATVQHNSQGWRQVSELLAAFGLSTVVGLERQFRGKSAGMRTQAIVGTASALFIIVSKYGFDDVAGPEVILDPSRVAAQVVSGIGFLGAGLIITRRGAIRGLTTAAAVWETAAIGMAAGAGLGLLALVVTALHFVIVLGYTPLGRMIARRGHSERDFTITYRDGQGVLRDLLSQCTRRGWTIGFLSLSQDAEQPSRPEPGLVTVLLTLTGQSASEAANILAAIDGVVRIAAGEGEDE